MPFASQANGAPREKSPIPGVEFDPVSQQLVVSQNDSDVSLGDADVAATVMKLTVCSQSQRFRRFKDLLSSSDLRAHRERSHGSAEQQSSEAERQAL